MDTQRTDVAAALELTRRELDQTLTSLADTQAEALGDLADAVSHADRVFVLGAGRSGLALRMTAMRLMHLGLDAYVVGETTTPALRAGDLLLVASGSGETGMILRAVDTAVSVNAPVAALTADAASTLAQRATHTVIVPAAGKQDRSEQASAQYAGGLFEQSVVLVGDALFHALWKASGVSADDLWPRHANLE